MKTSALIKEKLPQIAALLDTPLSELEWITGQKISIAEMSFDELCEMHHRLSPQVGLPYAERLLTMPMTVEQTSKAYFYVFADNPLEQAFWDKVFAMSLTIEQIQGEIWRLALQNKTQTERLTEMLQSVMDERLAQPWTLEEFGKLLYRLHSPYQNSVQASMIKVLEERIRNEIDTEVPLEDLHKWNGLLQSGGSAEIKRAVFEKLFARAETYADFKKLDNHADSADESRIFQKMLALGTWDELLELRRDLGDSQADRHRQVCEELLSLADTIEKIVILYKVLDRISGIEEVQEGIHDKIAELVQEQLRQERTFEELMALSNLPIWGKDLRLEVWSRVKAAASTLDQWKLVFNNSTRKDERRTIIKKIAALM